MRLTPDDLSASNAPDVHPAEVPPGVVIFQKRRAVTVVVPDDGDVAMPPVSDGDRPVIVSWPISCQPESAVAKTEGVGSSASTESGSGTSGGMGKVVPFVGRDRQVTVTVDGGSVVPMSAYRIQSISDRWNSIAGVGVTPVTDDQLRDVFLLMVAEMSGMTVVGRGGEGNQNTNEA